MIIFGADIHPVYQAGIPIEALPGAGIDFLSVKVSQGTSSVYLSQGSLSMIRRALDAGMLVVGYHWLVPGNEDAQAATFAAALTAAGVTAGVSDVEDVTPARVPTLTIAGIRAFHEACSRRGAHVAFMYLPHWYWEAIGNPGLAELPMLWASSYPSTAAGTPQVLYSAVDDSRWAGYGGLSVGPLQFASSGILAGYQPVDVNAFAGSRAQLARLIGSTRRRRHQDMGYIIEPTPIPAGAADGDRPQLGWPHIEYTLGAPGPAGGWPGRVLMHATFGFHGATVQECWSTPSGHHFIPAWDPVTNLGGAYIEAFQTQNWELPPGDTAVVMRVATRAKGSVIPETQD